jgi:hypothetical protein
LTEADLSNAFLERANLSEADLRQADLNTAYLFGANLRRADLNGANLSGASLNNADLNRANLSLANLSGAELSVAALTEANLRLADLSGAVLEGADLFDADLRDTNLSGANLRGANLSGANLGQVNLTGADLRQANLAHARIDPRYETDLPNFEYWQSVEHLSQVIIPNNAATLGKFQRLREDFRVSGLRTEERGVTAALARAQTRAPEMNPLERVFRVVAFDATSEYGNSPGRPLGILFFVGLLFALPYTFSLTRSPRGRGAIWRVWNEDRLLDLSGEKDRKKREQLSGLAFRKALALGIYFSLLSAFHFGWRDLNVGSWITRIQPREYALRASGWVRALSGIQSLLSVYLVALATLAYFGRPFG